MKSLELMRSFIIVAEEPNKTPVLPQTSSNCNTSDENNANETENMTIKPVSDSSSQKQSQSTAVTSTQEVDLSQMKSK